MTVTTLLISFHHLLLRVLLCTQLRNNTITFIPFRKGRVTCWLERAVGLFAILTMPSVELRARIREQNQVKKDVLVKCVYRGVAYNKKEG